MKVSRSTLTGAVLLVLALTGASSAGASQAFGKTELQSERGLLENARVRVLEYTSKPAGGVCGLDRHSHPAHVTIVLEPAHERLILGDGKVEEAEMKVGDVFWSDGETHTDLNVGKTTFRLIVVELK